MTSLTDPRAAAEARFKKKEKAASEGAKAMAEHQAAGEATRKKTERLKSERLAKEAADKKDPGRLGKRT